MYLYGTPSPSRLGAYPQRRMGLVRRGKRNLSGLGDSVFDYLYNTITGNLDSNQTANLKTQETASLVQAGMDPASAAAQADADVNETLSTFTGRGALGVQWTGAGPTSPTFAQAASTQAGQAIAAGVTNAGESLVEGASAITGGVPSWIWWVGGAVVGFIILRRLR